MITVCIVARNEEGNIERCLSSVLRTRRGGAHLEILLIDNDSSDSTVERAARFLELHPEVPSRILALPGNHLGRARRLAVQEARADFVAFIDADCEAPPDWARALHSSMVELRRADPRVAAVGSGNIVPPGQRDPFRLALGDFLASRIGNLGSLQAYRPGDRLEVGHLATCNVLYDRKSVLAVGNFSEEFGEVCEDLELSHRLRHSGFKLVFVPGNDVLHHHRAGFRDWAAKMRRYGKGQILVARRHPRHLLGPKALPLAFAVAPMAALAIGSKFLAALFLSYALATAVASFAAVPEGARLGRAARVLALFWITHGMYAAGEVSGVLDAIRERIGFGAREG